MSEDDLPAKDRDCHERLRVYPGVKMENPPGLAAIRYRVGTHTTFKASMIAILSKHLKKLTTRADDDFAIGLLDAWATVADVLTFYQERIANEGFLRTATEPRSVLELARAIGYDQSIDRDRARQNVPLKVLTLDRIVSLKDFENFALGFAGIGMTKAIETWDGGKKVVQLTVATVDGKPLESPSELYENLVDQLNTSKDPSIEVRFRPFNLRKFNVEAAIAIAKDRKPDAVKRAINAAVLNKFSFQKRQFGQPVTLSEITASIQQVEGVVMVDLHYLYDSKKGKDLSDLIPDEITDIFTINPEPEGVKLELKTL